MTKATINDDQPIRLVQITDTHLYANPDGALLGLNTDVSFQQVLERIDADNPAADFYLATGDLVHDGSADGYKRLRDHLKALDAPVYCLPGNHDDPDNLARILNSGQIKSLASARIKGWGLVFIDSTLRGSTGGHLTKQALRHLEAELESQSDLHILICLHHQPVPIGSEWLDTMLVDNADAFFDIVDRFAHVRGVVWGHVHQIYDEIRNGVRLLACPSTCVQFEPGSKTFGLDSAPPGYRCLSLYADGRIETEVKRLSAYPEGLNQLAGGYK